MAMNDEIKRPIALATIVQSISNTSRMAPPHREEIDDSDVTSELRRSYLIAINFDVISWLSIFATYAHPPLSAALLHRGPRRLLCGPRFVAVSRPNPPAAG